VTPAVIGLADLGSKVGDALGHSSWRTITQDDVGGTISFGYFTLSLATVFLDEVVTVDGAELVLNYGSNRVRYPAPVPVGSRIRAGVEVAAVENTGSAVQATFRLTFEIDGATKPGCVADIVYRYYASFPAR